MRDTSVKKCVIGCETTGRLIRGLCKNCYPHARVRVAKGLVTWDALEKAGLALPASQLRPRVSAFAQKMAEAGLTKTRIVDIETANAAMAAFERGESQTAEEILNSAVPPWKQKAQ